MKIKISIRAKLFILFSIIFLASMTFLTYMATRIVTQFGEYSAIQNETSIKSQASFFLSQVTQEKALRCENIFRRIAVSSFYLAKQASINLANEKNLGNIPFGAPDKLFRAPNSQLYSNLPTDPVMVLYWGEKRLHKGITSHLNALSYIDPLLKTTIFQNDEAVASFVTFEKATTRYFPNFPSIIRNLSKEAYEIRNSAWYKAVKPKNNPEKKTIWAEIYQDPAGRGLMTTAVSPVYDVNNIFIGATGVDVTLGNITDKILATIEKDHPMKTKGMFSFITDAKGRIVGFPKEYLSLFGFEKVTRLKSIGYNALFNLKLSDSEFEPVRRLWGNLTSIQAPKQERIILKGEQLLISSFIMPSTGWRLGVAVPESNLLESIQETRMAMKTMVNAMVLKFGFFALIIMVASIVGFAILSFKYFIRPLDTLINAAICVKDGDLAQQVKIERNDEIGILAHTFNGMVIELKKLNIKEKEYAKKLQQKVKERTIELEDKSLQQEKTLGQLKQEIGERKEIEYQLGQSKEKYRDIFNNSVQGIFQSSLDNKIINANPSMAIILGYDSIDEFLSSIQNLAEQVYVQPEQRKRFIELLKVNDFVSGFETQLRKKDGSHVWVSICGRAIKNDSGAIDYIQGSFEDISERIHAQEIFEHAKKIAEDASRAKSEFLTIMSHEIRTPLNAIIGMTRLTLTTNLDKTQNEYLDAVLISSDHLLTLLNNILDFSKIEAGKFVLEKKEFDITALLNDMMTMFTFQAQKKQLDLTYSTQKIPRLVKGDVHRLKQILVNLVGNAIKFTNAGAITIDVTIHNEAKRNMDSDGVMLLFSIKDTGIGIPSDKLKSVFNDFTQLKSEHSMASGGSGLGLTITRQLIHLMHGDIWVKSQHGKGSVFYFTIQLALANKDEFIEVSKPAPGMTAAPCQSKGYTPIKILLAEDFEVNQKLLVPFLERYGHSVIIAENGNEVLKLLASQSVDLILMDIKMPVMDGIEATRQIRKHKIPSIANIPIIALTAHAIKGDREKFIDAGMDEYVSKPIQGGELLNMIEQFATGKTLKTKEPTKQYICNLEYAHNLMGGNKDIVNEICKTIIIKFPKEIKKIEKAIKNKDLETLTITAHALKSGAKSIDAKPFLYQVQAMETAGKEGDLVKAHQLFKKLFFLSNQVVQDLKAKIR